MSYNILDLPNGIRFIHSPSSSKISHLGIYIDTGSRDEQEHEQGIAHFIEHMAFKGTTRRKAYHILNRLDSVGGDLNAFTTKEHTCLYASFLRGYERRAAELFADIILHSLFPEKEIEKEKGIILDEINTYKDTPSEAIFDDFEELLYGGHPLGRNILGTPQSVDGITKKQIIRFIQRNYSPAGMVIAYSGGMDSNRLSAIFLRYFETMPWNSPPRSRTVFTRYLPLHKTIRKMTHQTHAIMGTLAYPLGDPRTTAMHLLNNMIGGPGSNSRLNLALRERRGYTYHVESNYQAFSDTGYFSIYLGTTSDNPSGAIEAVYRELAPFTAEPLGTMQLHRAKTQLAGQLALAFDSKLSEMLSIGKRVLYNQQPDTADSLMKRIHSLTAVELLETAREVFIRNNFSELIYPADPHDHD
jgi:predicted Zn-dependent peptidase